MPRYRKLQVKTTESLDLNDMPDDTTRLMWVLMPLALCREGRGVDHPAWLKSRIFPLRDSAEITDEFLCGAMEWFEEHGLIVRYRVDGRRYFYVPTFHDEQGSTERETESHYPPPPDEVPTEARPIREQVTTHSRPTHEQVTTNSCSDAVCSTQYADTDADADAQAPEPSPGGEPDETVSVPSTFAEWQEEIRGSKNRVAVLRRMCEVLYPGLDPPGYAYIGRAARTVGGAGRLADLLWQHSTRPPTGDLLAYLQGVARGNGNGRRRPPGPVAEVPLATGFVDE